MHWVLCYGLAFFKFIGSSVAIKRDEVTRRFRNSFARKPLTIYERIIPDGSFLRPHPRHLGQLQKLNTCWRKPSARTATRFPLPPHRERHGKDVGRRRQLPVSAKPTAARSRCESRRFPPGVRRQHPCRGHA